MMFDIFSRRSEFAVKLGVIPPSAEKLSIADALLYWTSVLHANKEIQRRCLCQRHTRELRSPKDVLDGCCRQIARQTVYGSKKLAICYTHLKRIGLRSNTEPKGGWGRFRALFVGATGSCGGCSFTANVLIMKFKYIWAIRSI